MVKLYKIKFLKDTALKKIGEIGEATKKNAEQFISQGYAEYVKEQKKPIKKPKKEKKTKEIIKKEKKKLPDNKIMDKLNKIHKMTIPFQKNKELRLLKEKSDYSLQELKDQLKYIKEREELESKEIESKEIKEFLEKNKDAIVVIDTQDYLKCERLGKDCLRSLEYWLAEYNKEPFDSKEKFQKIKEFDIVIKLINQKYEEKKDQTKEAIQMIADYNHHAKSFIKIQPFFYYSSKIWCLWNDESKYLEIRDEISSKDNSR